jgi:hypothetical protein
MRCASIDDIVECSKEENPSVETIFAFSGTILLATTGTVVIVSVKRHVVSIYSLHAASSHSS